MRERAAGEAALLMSPRIVLQGMRFPTGGQVPVGTGVVVGSGYQARAGLSISPIDIYRGTRMGPAGDADCDQHEASESIRRLLFHGTDALRVSALRAQAAYLRDHRDELQLLTTRAEQRFTARVITVVELQELRRRCDAVERKLSQTDGEANQLQQNGAEPPRDALGALTQRYERLAMRVEEETAHLRSLDAWHFQLTAGVIPLSPVDWFGLAELSFSPGGLLRNRHDRNYLAAREDELNQAPYELVTQARAFRQQLAAALEQARHDLELDDRDFAIIANTRQALERSSAPDVAHAHDTLEVEELSIASDRVYLRAWIESLSAMLENTHGF